MKYIKLFESKTTGFPDYKLYFEVGDYVKLSRNHKYSKNHAHLGKIAKDDKIFIIDQVDSSEIPYYIIGVNTAVSTWATESEIELVPEIEVDALKYNL